MQGQGKSDRHCAHARGGRPRAALEAQVTPAVARREMLGEMLLELKQPLRPSRNSSSRVREPNRLRG